MMSDDRPITLHEKLLDLVDDGPVSVAQMIGAIPEYTQEQIKNAVQWAKRKGCIHCTRGGKGGPGLYVIGPEPGWMPRPMPFKSVWDYAQRA